MKYKIVGLRVENVVMKMLKGCNLEFEEFYGEDKKYFFLLKGEGGCSKYELEIFEEQRECYSGWTIATHGIAHLREVERFAGITHKPKVNVSIEYPFINEENNELFSFSEVGGDQYYPSGFIVVDFDKFEVGPRYKEKRPVWIYHGASSLGKSYLTNHYDVYETDSEDKLPEFIYKNIIVLGNKYKYTLEDVKSRIFNVENCDVILVNFSHEDEIKKLNERIKELEFLVLHYENKPPEEPSPGYEFAKDHWNKENK